MIVKKLIQSRPLKNLTGFVVMLGVSVSISAQTPPPGPVETVAAGSDAQRASFGNVRVWVAPAVGGTPEDRAYFDFMLPEEVKGGGYELTNTLYPTLEEAREQSDFYITSTLEYDEEYQDTVINSELYNTRTGAQIITSSMGYKTTEEMNDWNLTMIYRLMANAPIFKSISGAETVYLPQEVQQAPKKEYPEYRLFLGLRLGYSSHFYKFPKDSMIEKNNMGASFEAALQVSFHPWHHFGFQGEFVFATENASYRNFESDGGAGSDVILQKEQYKSKSLLIPLLFKGIIPFGPFVAEPLVGLYFTFPLGTMTTPTGKTSVKYSVPLGFTLGADLGMYLGPGILFLDFRFSGDFGKVVRPNGTEIYKRNMLSISLGYKFGLMKRKPPVQEADLTQPVQETDLSQPKS
jgi:hypothetical protein